MAIHQKKLHERLIDTLAGLSVVLGMLTAIVAVLWGTSLLSYPGGAFSLWYVVAGFLLFGLAYGGWVFLDCYEPDTDSTP